MLINLRLSLMSEAAWWQEAFQAEYLSIYAHRDDASAQAEVAGVDKQLQRFSIDKNTGVLLDACCGNGRHAAALSDSGYNIYAFDYSADLLQVAQQRLQLRDRLFQADVRHLPFEQRFSAITLFFTAYGYFDDASNQDVMNCLGQSLCKGGVLMLDLPNPQQVREGLQPHSRKELSNGLIIDETRYLDAAYVAKDVRIEADGVLQRSYTERVRLYELAELETMAAIAGLEIMDCWPSLVAADLDQNRKVYWLQRSR